jgi:quercetin dioxygenase-like cupin family protein
MNARNKIFAAITFGMLATGLYSARGVAQTTAAPGPVGTVLQMSSEVTNLNMPADFTAFNRITYVAPGGGVPLHWHPGPFTLLVLEGELTAITRGVEKVYKTGDSWTDGVGPDSAHELWNRGKIMAKYSLMGMLPKGAPVSTFVTK